MEIMDARWIRNVQDVASIISILSLESVQKIDEEAAEFIRVRIISMLDRSDAPHRKRSSTRM